MVQVIGLNAGVVGHTVALVLAQDPVPPDQGEEFGKASPVGLVVVLVLGIATIFLIRSMTKHLRKVPPSFDPPASADGSDASAHGATTEPAPRPTEGGGPRPADAEPSPDR